MKAPGHPHGSEERDRWVTSPSWLSGDPSPAVVVRLEPLDEGGRTLLVRVGDDEAIAIWRR